METNHNLKMSILQQLLTTECKMEETNHNLKMSKSYIKDWIVIGISGVTCGGKTTLANKLKEMLAPVYVFNQDVYFYPDDSPKHVKVPGMDHNNYDILSSLDMERMHRDIVATLGGSKDRALSHHEDCAGRRTVPGRKFLILEGFTLLNYRPIFDLCMLRYYFILSYEECVRRRSLRTYDPPDVPGYFEHCVWPEHVRHRRELEAASGVQLVEGTLAPEAVVDRVMGDVHEIAGGSKCCSH